MKQDTQDKYVCCDNCSFSSDASQLATDKFG